MGTAYQANKAKGTRQKGMRPDKVRHTITMLSTLFDAIRTAALASNRSLSEEMVARLSASFEPSRDRGERVAVLATIINRSNHCDWLLETCRAGACQCKALADEAIDALEGPPDG